MVRSALPRLIATKKLAVPAVLLALITGCSGGDTPAPASAPSNSVSTTAAVGSGGRTVTHPDGVEVVIPAGALSGDTVIGIRSNPGNAPAPLQEGNALAGPIYEFTPHDVVFNTPVILRIPILAGAVNRQIFMASLGGGWEAVNGTPNGAFIEVQRNSFSFGAGGLACSIPAGNTDPYPCFLPSGGATVTAAPTTAITQIASGWLNYGVGGAGSWAVNPPGGAISITMQYRAALDCSSGSGGAPSGHAKLTRWAGGASPRVVTTVFDQDVSMTPEPFAPPSGTFAGGASFSQYGAGSTTVDVSAHLGDATNVFLFTFTCRRPGRTTSQGGSDLITILGPMAPPTGSFTVGGTVSGLTGTGLVLRNNGGDDLAISANGSFQFSTPIAVGNPYNVTVATGPSGQTCAVQNGSGTINGAITTVTVNCAGVVGNIAEVTLASGHTCARHTDGRVRCWGGQTFGGELGLGDSSTRGDGPGEMGTALPYVNLGTGRTAVQLRAGAFSTCAILDNGALKCWGGRVYGLGLGSGFQSLGDSPSEMGDNLPAVNLGTGVTATKVAMNISHACAIVNGGGVKCWGFNDTGLLGLGFTAQFGDSREIGDSSSEMGNSLPFLSLGTNRTAVDISVGYSGHACARLDNNTFKCWGNNNNGALGLGDINSRGDGANEMGDNLPAIDVGTGLTVTKFGTGAEFTCALLNNGSVKCWGRNTAGQLGQGDITARGDNPNEMGNNLQPVNLGPGRTATDIAVGASHACALLDDGSVKCWGDNSSGKLGLGDTLARGDGANEMGSNLSAVSLGAGRTAVAIYANFDNTCAKLDTGFVKCWGQNARGNLGLGDILDRGDGPNEMGDNLQAVDLTQ